MKKNTPKTKEEILIKFGDKVRIERLKRRWSQIDLANKSNLHFTYIGNIERAEKSISLTNIQKIAIALDIDILELLNFKDL